MITAIELDDLLANLTLDQADMIRQQIPPGFADQICAASSQLEAQAEAICDRPGATRRLSTSEVDDWLRLGLLDTFTKWVAGQARTCKHMPDARRPEPVWAAAWKPGLVVCTACLHLHRLASAAADRVCDGCGHSCEGPEFGDGITPIVLSLGGFGYRAGACGPCTPESLRAV